MKYIAFDKKHTTFVNGFIVRAFKPKIAFQEQLCIIVIILKNR